MNVVGFKPFGNDLSNWFFFISGAHIFVFEVVQPFFNCVISVVNM